MSASLSLIITTAEEALTTATDRNNFNKTWLHTDKEAEFKAVYELLPDHKIGLLNLVSQPNNKIVPSYSMGYVVSLAAFIPRTPFFLRSLY